MIEKQVIPTSTIAHSASGRLARSSIPGCSPKQAPLGYWDYSSMAVKNQGADQAEKRPVRTLGLQIRGLCLGHLFVRRDQMLWQRPIKDVSQDCRRV